MDLQRPPRQGGSLRYSDALLDKYLNVPEFIKESTTYQGIVQGGRAVGRIEQAWRTLIRQGTLRFGSPVHDTLVSLMVIQEIDPLETLLDRILDPDILGWDDLLKVD